MNNRQENQDKVIKMLESKTNFAKSTIGEQNNITIEKESMLAEK